VFWSQALGWTVAVWGCVMDPHKEAWKHVSAELYGSVCEVARRVPWGFKQDRRDIENQTVDTFLSEKRSWGTVVLHILAGEGEPVGRVLGVIDNAYQRCVKLAILEHTPGHADWEKSKTVLHEKIRAIVDHVKLKEPGASVYSWGRNMIISTTTLAPLTIPLSDSYYDENIGVRYVGKNDHGCDKEALVYTHTSEDPISDDIIEQTEGDTVWWVAGGGLCFEAIHKRRSGKNHIIDSTLAQLLYVRHMMGGAEKKIESLVSLSGVSSRANGYNLPPWRNVFAAVDWSSIVGKIEGMYHIPLDRLDVAGDVVYVSSVHRRHWTSVAKKNTIISSFAPRNRPTLLPVEK